jgi:hypothetical protein
MLRDAETTSIAERMNRSPLGGNAGSPPPRRRALFFLFFGQIKVKPHHVIASPKRCRGIDKGCRRKDAERSTKLCHSNDYETDYAVQRPRMLFEHRRPKRLLFQQRSYGYAAHKKNKKEWRSGFSQLHKPCFATQRPPLSPRGCAARL